MIQLLCLVLIALVVQLASAVKPIDVYLNKVEPVYKWEKLHNETYKTVFGSTVYVLNVTSLEWLDVSKAAGANGALWTHLVYVVVPEKLTYTNISFAYITGGENTKPNDVQGIFDENTWEVDILAYYSESIVIAIE